MVGRLVEDEEIHGFQQQANHCQSASFSSTEHLYLLVTLFTAKHKGAKDIIDPKTDRAFRHMIYRLENGQAFIKQLSLVLGKITNLHIMSDLQFSRIGNFAHNTLDERGFSFSVLSYEGNLFTALNRQRHMIENSVGTIVLPHVITDNRIITAAQTWRKLQVHRRVVHLVDLDGHDFLQLLNLLLHLNSLGGLIAETLDEILHLCHFLLLVLVGSDLLFTTLFTQNDILVIFHLVVDHSTTGYL